MLYKPDTIQFAYFLTVTLVCISLLDSVVSEVRYVKYITLPLLLIIWFASEQRFKLFVKDYTLPFLLLLLSPIYSFYNMTIFGYKDIFFIASYLAIFLFFRDIHINVKRINILLAALFILSAMIDSRGYFFVSMINSYSTLENATFGFIFGFFAIYWMTKKKYVAFVLNAIFLFLSFKKIAFIGLVLVFLIWCLPKRIQKMVVNLPVIISVNILALMLIILFSRGTFDELIMNIFDMSANALSMGRQTLYANVSYEITRDLGSFFFMGMGLGTTYSFVAEYGAANLHSDMLKIFSELGFLVFIAFICLLYRVATPESKLLAMYLNIIFLSDNILIYVSVMFFYFLLLSQNRVDSNVS